MLVRRVWPSRPTFESPMAELDRARREMQRAFDALSGGGPTEAWSGAFPPMNVTQDDDHFYVRTEVPGIAPNALSISAHQRRLSISGRREIPAEQEGVSYHRKERPEGSFARTVTLPMAIDAERVEARCQDGVLTVKLPKAAEAKPRQIVVKA